METFATRESLPASLAYVNQCLVSFGLGEALALDGLDAARQVDVVNALFALLRHRAEEQQVRADLEQRLQRQQVELEAATMRLARSEKRALEAEREVDMLRARLSTVETTLRTTAGELKETKGELQKTTVKAQSRDAQYKVEQRKKEREFFKLQERLAKAATDRAKDGKTTIRILNPLKPVKLTAGRANTVVAEPDDEATRLIIAGYEEREKEFTNENAELRQTLLTLQRRMETLVGAESAAAPEAAADDVDPAQPMSEFEVVQLRLPYELVKGTVHENALSLIQQLEYQLEVLRGDLEEREARLQTLSDQSPQKVEAPANVELTKQLREQIAADQAARQALEAELETLRTQVDEQQNLLAEQERLLQLALEDEEANRGHARLDQSLQIEDYQPITPSDVLEQREALERQRRQLEQEKAAMEAQRRKLQQEQLFARIPPTPDWLRQAIAAGTDLGLASARKIAGSYALSTGASTPTVTLPQRRAAAAATAKPAEAPPVSALELPPRTLRLGDEDALTPLSSVNIESFKQATPIPTGERLVLVDSPGQTDADAVTTAGDDFELLTKSEVDEADIAGGDIDDAGLVLPTPTVAVAGGNEQ